MSKLLDDEVWNEKDDPMNDLVPNSVQPSDLAPRNLNPQAVILASWIQCFLSFMQSEYLIW